MFVQIQDVFAGATKATLAYTFAMDAAGCLIPTITCSGPDNTGNLRNTIYFSDDNSANAVGSGCATATLPAILACRNGNWVDLRKEQGYVGIGDPNNPMIRCEQDLNGNNGCPMAG